MSELLRNFYELWLRNCRDAVNPVYFRGSRPIQEAMVALGMELHGASAQSRLEFWSPRRESLSGVWIEDLPKTLSGEAVQRILAACFQGLLPGAPLVIVYSGSIAGLHAWMRQAGFDKHLEGSSGNLSAILGTKLGSG